MRTLNDTGIIRVEAHQWPAVRQHLSSLGYVLARDGNTGHPTVWDPCSGACVGEWHGRDRCYYLDERVRPHLPRPVGRPYRHDPYTDLGGES